MNIGCSAVSSISDLAAEDPGSIPSTHPFCARATRVQQPSTMGALLAMVKGKSRDPGVDHTAARRAPVDHPRGPAPRPSEASPTRQLPRELTTPGHPRPQLGPSSTRTIIDRRVHRTAANTTVEEKASNGAIRRAAVLTAPAAKARDARQPGDHPQPRAALNTGRNPPKLQQPPGAHRPRGLPAALLRQRHATPASLASASNCKPASTSADAASSCSRRQEHSVPRSAQRNLTLEALPAAGSRRPPSAPPLRRRSAKPASLATASTSEPSDASGRGGLRTQARPRAHRPGERPGQPHTGSTPSDRVKPKAMQCDNTWGCPGTRRRLRARRPGGSPAPAAICEHPQRRHRAGHRRNPHQDESPRTPLAQQTHPRPSGPQRWLGASDEKATAGRGAAGAAPTTAPHRPNPADGGFQESCRPRYAQEVD